MKRPYLLVILLIAVAGCAGRGPLARDAFFGRTAILPPGTGAAKPADDAYYTAPQRLSATSPDVSVRTAAATVESGDTGDSWKRTTGSSQTTTSSTRPTTSAWDLSRDVPRVDPAVRNASHVEHPSTARTTDVRWGTAQENPSLIRTRIAPPRLTTRTIGPPASSAIESSTNGPLTPVVRPPSNETVASTEPAAQPIVRMLQPRPGTTSQTPRPIADPQPTLAQSAPPAGGTWSSRTADPEATSDTTFEKRPARRKIVPSPVIKFADLPDARSPVAAGCRVDSQVRLASASIPTPQPTRATFRAPDAKPNHARPSSRSTNTPSLRYGHDPAYGCLRGRLEHSDVANRWKLRYIPVDGETDQYGGSVVLSRTTLLAGQKQGDFVEVRGRLRTGEHDDWGYAPVYEVSQLRPLTR